MTDQDAGTFIEFCESDFGRTIMDREAQYLNGYLDDRGLNLDVGVGIGSLEERLTGYRIVGVDRSRPMIRTARRRVDVPLLVGDARELPVAPNVVDTLFFVATLEFIPEVDRALDEARRVLRPGGTFLALILNSESHYVRERLDREGSYFRQMAHRDTRALTERCERFFSLDVEYILGIDGETVFETNDPEAAALLAVHGSPEA